MNWLSLSNCFNLLFAKGERGLPDEASESLCQSIKYMQMNPIVLILEAAEGPTPFISIVGAIVTGLSLLVSKS